MISTTEILNLASAYLDKKKTLDEFALGFAEVFYDIEKVGTPDALQLAYAIESKLADLSAGLCSEQDFDTLLMTYSPVNTAPATAASVFAQVVGAAQITYEVASVFSDKSLVRGFALPRILQQEHRTNTDPAQSRQVVQA
jgi:hypothetical protein